MKIAPDRYGSFDVLDRMTGVIDPKEVGSHPIEHDPLLSRPDLATDVAFTFDLGIRKQLTKDFGFPLEDLSLREQIAVIATMRTITSNEEQRMLSFIKNFGLDGARAFLSTEFGDGFRGTVLSIVEKFSDLSPDSFYKHHLAMGGVCV